MKGVQGLQKAGDMATVAAMPMAEDDIPERLVVGDDPAGQLQAISGAKANILEIQAQCRRRAFGYRVHGVKSCDQWHGEQCQAGKAKTKAPGQTRTRGKKPG